MKTAYLLVPFAPLVGAMVAGFAGRAIGKKATHRVAILGVLVSLLASLWVMHDVSQGNTFNGALYSWAVIGKLKMEVGFLIDQLTAMMMVVVTFVSLMVHVYTIGYMEEDDGYQRFFAYISLFTFSMLMLVMSNNLLQLFFGWEAVGLVSYLLIGFWYTKPSAIYANLKAFMVNRVGDFGFVLGIGLLVAWTGSLDYAEIFAAAPNLEKVTIQLIGDTPWSLITVTCICLFVGAMGKSAQFPLHVWLPDSMEGPTPISALIHAATMVTAGIFMVSRMSPLYEMSEVALSFVMIIGAITAFFMGLMGIIQNDIKRVVAYSTLSQLGYMTVALGASAYSVAVFHLMTHAFFKALLFLGAGSVIIGMHHDQDIRHMGGLRKYMPITWVTSLIGSLALVGTPFFSGFYSKESIIEAVHHANVPGSGIAYWALLSGVFVTAFYSFRMYFLVFHGKPRFETAHGHDAHGHDAHGHDGHGAHVPHESPWVVTVPLVLLAIPSIIIGAIAADSMITGEYFKGVITVFADRHPAMAALAEHWHGWVAMALHGFTSLPFWLMVAGIATAWYFYLVNPAIPARLQQTFKGIYTVLENKYYLDRFNEWFFAGGARRLGSGLWKRGDQGLIDGLVVNGSARLVGWFSRVLRQGQTGFLNHYAIAMIIGLAFLLFWFLPLLASAQ
ncbi:NADH-quinone oxidoreductase subunit L [Lautropia mirabilis]|jgi:proton-translocating NADH-quinone oxidoreductase, chain L|uniref:Proton-translocating NADH-quinone oxidoreductase, chain L n=1 Tax=Lautropia mirabilis ATCC 51599 TaxID=887898 RepID=E7RUX5_9BURK|nr:NADH-quinone oxidoreductase subunit L [Lautropia mirabilis]EFV95579.1 proton-translocating NADH-quinone oxidoreductase, chain L [Lautropia mirabilis ATCC 51599]MBF1247833.1 NADH-quinone oxidoreductase subunit L [Lautropia mirabilis]VEH03117.1 NADH-quinone oxidoreductase subunit L [Lautropia mirabilis]